ncbi:MAG: NAD(P)-binding domain-containing protein [Caulobacteraceae bacterium]|nr:NAD(P)-binding domain-containing protein [Caulobacteraceae bacterium]
MNAIIAPRAVEAGEKAAVVVIGAGQAGLSVGYHLARLGVPFVILDAGARVGDSWRHRWDSLRLFSPAQFDGLDGMAHPAPSGAFPSKDQMADYLAAYARRFALPVRSGVTVDGLWREGGRYLVSAGERLWEADQVVVAMSNYQQPRIPAFASDLDPQIRQIHSRDYRNPAQLEDGPALVVGAGNSGAEIALELAKTRTTWLAGRDVGQVPFRIESFLGRHLLVRLVFRLVFHRLLTLDTPIGRKARAAHAAAPLIRTRWRDLLEAGVERGPKMSGVRDGRPVLEDGREPEVANIVWCTGFRPGFAWIRLPVFGPAGEPLHERGVAKGQPGLYFLGLDFLYAMSSTMIHGVGRDARRLAEIIAGRLSSQDAPGRAAPDRTGAYDAPATIGARASSA